VHVLWDSLLHYCWNFDGSVSTKGSETHGSRPMCKLCSAHSSSMDSRIDLDQRYCLMKFTQDAACRTVRRMCKLQLSTAEHCRTVQAGYQALVYCTNFGIKLYIQ